MKIKVPISNSILLLLSVFILNSCATHTGYLSTNAVIVDNNFKIVGLAVGESESVKVFGFGGLNKDVLVFDAKKDLYSKIELKPGQALTNITVDFKKEFYLVYSRNKVTLTAEVVDFNVNEDKPILNMYGLNERNGFKLNDSVYVKVNNTFSLGNIKSMELKHLLIKTENDGLVSAKYDDVYSLTGTFKHDKELYSVGDNIVVFEMSNTPVHHDENVDFTGTVIGLSNKNALLYESTKHQFKVIKKD